MPNKKILIVDDEPDIAEVLGDRLEANDFNVRIVNSARTCYIAVDEDPPDLILLDIQMPGTSGMEALEVLKKKYPQIPVLMISASTVHAAAKTSEAKGSEGFLLKPFEPKELMQKVNQILGLE